MSADPGTCQDGSFTCTLFLPSKQFADLENDPCTLPAFFDQHFPGVTDLIPGESLISFFNENPHLPLISLRCRPYHHSSSGIIIGDAAHAMVPFYGQGMNAGMEDVRILFSVLDRHAEVLCENYPNEKANVSCMSSLKRAQALAEYSAVREPDAHAINNLALQNYVEMRSSVLSKRYRLRKFLEEYMSTKFPGLGWHTKYSRVSFSNEPYAYVVRQSDHQGRVLLRSFMGLLASPFVVTGLVLACRHHRTIMSGLCSLLGLQAARSG